MTAATATPKTAPKANHLKSAEVHNFKGLHQAKVTFPGSGVIIIGGRNGSGKTSFTDAIWAALGGASALDDVPVMQGQEEATIRLEIDTDPPLIVERTIKSSGGSPALKVYTEMPGPTGKPIKSNLSGPQSVLNTLVGKVAFDPLEFIRLKPADQVKLLAELVGVDVSRLDGEIAALMQERQSVKKERDKLSAVVEGMPHHTDAPSEIVSTEALVKELSHAEAANTKRAQLEHRAKEQTTQKASLEKREQELLAQLEKVRFDIQAAAQAVTEFSAQAEQSPVIDVEPIKQRISMASSINRKVEDNRQRATSQQALENKDTEVTVLTNEIEAKRQARLKMMEEAEWPVPGLGFSDAGVTYNDLPIGQICSAEKIKVSTAIGLGQNPQLKLMFIHDGSLLDDEGLAIIEELAVAHDAQVFVERVGTGDEGAIIIEEGYVRQAV